MMENRKIKLQKYISQAGISSRRGAEQLIAKGLVSVNKQIVTEPGIEVDPEKDKIEVKGEKITPQSKTYIALHKPAGYLCSMNDNFGRPLVTELVREIPQRIYHVGRLDLHSEGLLIMTNDGSLSQLLTHPGHQIDKTYLVKLRYPLDNQKMKELSRGVTLDDGFTTSPARIRIVSRDRRKIEIIIREGKKRQVKRMLRAVGNRVTYLKRTSIGPVQLGELPRGKWRELGFQEIRALKRLAEIRNNIFNPD